MQLFNFFKHKDTAMSTQDLSPASAQANAQDPVTDLITNLATQPQPGVLVVTGPSAGTSTLIGMTGPALGPVVGSSSAPDAKPTGPAPNLGVSQAPKARTIEDIKSDIDKAMITIEGDRQHLQTLQNEFGDACASYHDAISRHL